MQGYWPSVMGFPVGESILAERGRASACGFGTLLVGFAAGADAEPN